MLRTLFLLMLLPATLYTWAQGTTYSRIAIALEQANDMERLGALGLPIDHAELKDGTCVVELSTEDIQRVRAEGFRTRILIEDLSTWYASRAQDPPTGERALGWLCDGPTLFDVPEHFNNGSMGGYLTLAEMEAELDEMVTLYPSLISAKVPIGASLEGRPINFVRISNAPNTDQDKPEVLYTALHHAREPVSMSQLLFFMWWVLENYGTDPQATYLVDNRELYFVPCLNPDGYVFNQAGFPQGGGMWRKNRRDNGDGTFGVDLNRNYGWSWGLDNTGSSPLGSSETYRGTEPFSEPETQAVRDFCNMHEFRAALNYHAFGDMVIHPWGSAADLLTPDSSLFSAHAEQLTRNNGNSRGTCQQVLYYLTNGSSDDWMYGEQTEKPKILAMTPEIGQGDEGFWPPAWRILPLCQENVDQNLLQAHLVGSYAVARDRSHPILMGSTVDVPFEVQRLGLDAATFTVTIEPLENVVSADGPKSFADMDLLETRRDSIGITLAPSLLDGDRIRFILAVSNGPCTHRDTVERYFGLEAVPFADAGDDLEAWSTNTWGLSNTHWHSPPSSITDSPEGDYGPFDVRTLVSSTPIDLSDATVATLRFWARWEIGQIMDLVEVSASNDGVSWATLCGIHTRPGSSYQGNDIPVFEGRRFDWVQEEMDLTAFTGDEVYLRFSLVSANMNTRDGFYLDDLEVLTVGQTTSGIVDAANPNTALSCWPHPASDQVTFRRSSVDPARLRIINAAGTTVLERPFNGTTLELDLQPLSAGLYACSVTTNDGMMTTTRLVIAR